MEIKLSTYVFLVLDNDIIYSLLEQTKKLVNLTEYNLK